MTNHQHDAPDCAGRNGAPAHGKHTPGPWVVWYSDWPGVVGVECASGETIADCSHSNAPDLSEANARLIAAAPDMLEALITALPYIESAEEDEAYKPGVVAKVTAQARAAIAHATGAA